MDGHKVPPDEINGGFEFNNQLPNWRAIYTTSNKNKLIEGAESRPYAIAYGELPGHEHADVLVQHGPPHFERRHQIVAHQKRSWDFRAGDARHAGH